MSGRQIVRRIALVAALAATTPGCAAKLEQRISMLEDVNRNLTERLNLARDELREADSERDELNRRLLAARDETDALQGQLAERAAPEEAASGWIPVPGGAMIAIEGSVLFTPGKVTLRDEARRTLDAIVSTVQGEYADMNVLVVGHTDDQPIKKSGWTDNYQLSAERALAVVRYLRDHGVSPARLVTCGCGEHRPRVPGASEANRAANRRVEIFAIDPQLLTSQP
ncbi:MAG: OmpA family protein [Phycisphaerae bacterium]